VATSAALAAAYRRFTVRNLETGPTITHHAPVSVPYVLLYLEELQPYVNSIPEFHLVPPLEATNDDAPSGQRLHESQNRSEPGASGPSPSAPTAKPSLPPPKSKDTSVPSAAATTRPPSRLARPSWASSS
jgi:hypothetical protein